MIRQKQCPDVLVQVGEEIFFCHLTVLQLSMEYFRNHVPIDSITFSTQLMPARGFQMIYDWVIDLDSKPAREHILDMYVAASFLKMRELMNHLWSRLDDPNMVTSDEAFCIYVESIPYNLTLLQELMLGRIHKFFILAVATEEYLDLEPKHIFRLISHHNMCVNSEMEMLLCALRWLFYDWSNRSIYAVTLMQAINFNAMPAWFTRVLKTKQSDPDMQEFVLIPEITTMINLGLSFSVTHLHLDPESSLRPPLKVESPPERQWVYHQDVRHHHIYECHRWRYLNMDAFEEFLQYVIDNSQKFLNGLEYVVPGQMMPCCQAALQKKLSNK
ncbi:hypothetical protein KR018_011523 [Drosophila ironensis]|nr:hypothetical protein KR018_011523 [Drosophila ironensis]